MTAEYPTVGDVELILELRSQKPKIRINDECMFFKKNTNGNNYNYFSKILLICTKIIGDYGKFEVLANGGFTIKGNKVYALSSISYKKNELVGMSYKLNLKNIFRIDFIENNLPLNITKKDVIKIQGFRHLKPEIKKGDICIYLMKDFPNFSSDLQKKYLDNFSNMLFICDETPRYNSKIGIFKIIYHDSFTIGDRVIRKNKWVYEKRKIAKRLSDMYNIDFVRKIINKD